MTGKKTYFNYLSSVIAARLISLIVAVLIIFNCAFAFNKSVAGVDSSLGVQKDVFSVIFFVSDTINKISSSLSQRFTLRSEAVPVSQKQDARKEKAANAGPAILPAELHVKNIFKTTYDFKTLYPVNESLNMRADAIPINKHDKTVVFYFLMMLLFFTAAKKSYDGVLFSVNHRTFL